MRSLGAPVDRYKSPHCLRTKELRHQRRIPRLYRKSYVALSQKFQRPLTDWQFDMPWLAESFAVARMLDMLTLVEQVPPSLFGGCWPCHTCGGIPSRICIGSAHVSATASE
jgi:hypothetical protein